MGDKFRLPEPILQVIQSFLSGRDAARTTLLSKSWGSAWLTRPNLDFDLSEIEPYNYCFRRTPSKSSEFVEKTLQRYEDSNLKIESFRLCLKIYAQYGKPNPNPNPWIVKALRLGATRLTLRQSRDLGCADLVLDEVLGVERLVELSLESCKLIMNNREVIIACSMLQSLSLNDVHVQPSDMISRIISSCPLIQKLSLCRVDGVLGDDSDHGLTGTIRGHGLRSLVLRHVYFDTLLLHAEADDDDDLSSKFPSLKELTLERYCFQGANDLTISSRSLEHVDVSVEKTFARVKFDVPSIRKFTFRGPVIPKLSIRSNSMSGSWESHVSISRNKCFSASWFCKVNKFLTKFKRSRISLSIRVISKTSFEYEAGDIQGLPTLEIENLNICHVRMPSISCLALFDGLFRICRPKIVTQYMCYDSGWSVGYSSSGRKKRYNIGFLGKKILQALDVEIPTPGPYQFMYGLNDLKEARGEIFDELVSAWRDVPLELTIQSETRQGNNGWYDDESLVEEFLDDSELSRLYEDKPKVRFQLNWQLN